MCTLPYIAAGSDFQRQHAAAILQTALGRIADRSFKRATRSGSAVAGRAVQKSPSQRRADRRWARRPGYGSRAPRGPAGERTCVSLLKIEGDAGHRRPSSADRGGDSRGLPCSGLGQGTVGAKPLRTLRALSRPSITR